MKHIISVLLLFSVPLGSYATPGPDLSFRHEFGGETDFRLRTGIGPPEFEMQLALAGSYAGAGVFGDPQAPAPLSVTVDAPFLSLGSLSLVGVLAELRSPVASSASSAHWEPRADLEADLSMDPVSRSGAILRLPVGVGVALWRERDELAAAFLSSATLSVHSLSAVAVSLLPDEASQPAEGWSSYDGPGEPATLAAVAWTTDGGRAATSVAVAASLPAWSVPALWVRLAAAVSGPGESTARFYAAAAAPGFRSPGGGSVSPAILSAALLRLDLGGVVGTVESAVRGSWPVERTAPLIANYDGTSAKTSLRWVITGSPVRASVSAGAGVDFPARSTDWQGVVDARWGASVSAQIISVSVSQRFSRGESWTHRELLSSELVLDSFPPDEGSPLELRIRGSAQTKWSPFELQFRLSVSGRYLLTAEE